MTGPSKPFTDHDGSQSFTGDIQLTFFQKLVPYGEIAFDSEFYESVPKFLLSARSSGAKHEILDPVRFDFKWGTAHFISVISPAEFPSRSAEDETDKQILPGPRECVVFRISQQLAYEEMIASDGLGFRQAIRTRLAISEVRSRLRTLGREFKSSEIRDAIAVLAGANLTVRSVASGTTVYSGPYLMLNARDRRSLQRCKVLEVEFHTLMAAGVTCGARRLRNTARLTPLCHWLCDLITRERSELIGKAASFPLTLSQVIQESGLMSRSSIRSNLRRVREALSDLVSAELIVWTPNCREQLIFEPWKGRGRRRVLDAKWDLVPSDRLS